MKSQEVHRKWARVYPGGLQSRYVNEKGLQEGEHGDRKSTYTIIVEIKVTYD